MPFLPQCLDLWKTTFHKSRITPCNNIGEWEQPSWIVPKTGKYRLIQSRNFFFLTEINASNVLWSMLQETFFILELMVPWEAAISETSKHLKWSVEVGNRSICHNIEHQSSEVNGSPCLWKTLRSEAASDFGSRGMTPTCQADPNPGVRRADVTQSNRTKWSSRGTSGKELTCDAGCRHWEMWGHRVTVTWCYIVTSLRQGVNLKMPMMLLLLPHSFGDDHAWDCTTLSINTQLC